MSKSRALRRRSAKGAKKQEAGDYQTEQQQAMGQKVQEQQSAEKQPQGPGEKVEEQQSGLSTQSQLAQPKDERSQVEKQQTKKRQGKKATRPMPAGPVHLIHEDDREVLSFPKILRPAARDPTTQPQPVPDAHRTLIEDTYTQFLSAPINPYICDAWIYNYREGLGGIRSDEVITVLGDMNARWFREALRGFEKDPDELGGEVYQWPPCPGCGCYKDKPRQKRVGKAHAAKGAQKDPAGGEEGRKEIHGEAPAG